MGRYRKADQPHPGQKRSDAAGRGQRWNSWHEVWRAHRMGEASRYTREHMADQMSLHADAQPLTEEEYANRLLPDRESPFEVGATLLAAGAIVLGVAALFFTPFKPGFLAILLATLSNALRRPEHAAAEDRADRGRPRLAARRHRLGARRRGRLVAAPAPAASSAGQEDERADQTDHVGHERDRRRSRRCRAASRSRAPRPARRPRRPRRSPSRTARAGRPRRT